MADNFIDQDETQIYGTYAAGKMRTRIQGLVPAFDAVLEHLATELDDATSAVADAVAHARATDAAIRKGTAQKGSALKNAVALLGRFSKHLDGHADGTVDRKVFFTADGTAHGVGKSVPRVLLALSHIGRKLRDPESPVTGAAGWATDFEATAAALSPVAEHADNAKTDRRIATPEVEAARAAWLTIYGASKLCVESVLRLTGKLDRMPRVFFDLAVPGNAKVTAAPVDGQEDTLEMPDQAQPIK